MAELAEQGAPAFKQSNELLEKLIKAEVAEREVRSINYQMNVAKFPARKDLTGFDFAESAVSEGQVRALHRCEFIDDAENIVFVGGPGTGKTHLATAIAVQAVTPPSPTGPLPLDRRTRQRPRAGKSLRQGRPPR